MSDDVTGDLIRELDIAAAALNEDQRRCVSCKHWQNPWDDFYDHGTDKIPAGDRSRWGVCALIQMPDYGETIGTAVAFTMDGSHYRADLHTRDDFGCVLWTEKDTEP